MSRREDFESVINRQFETSKPTNMDITRNYDDSSDEEHMHHWFWINDLLFEVPPTSINFQSEDSISEWETLRSAGSIKGHSNRSTKVIRIDIEIPNKFAIKNIDIRGTGREHVPGNNTGKRGGLLDLIIQFKHVHFARMENAFLRSLLKVPAEKNMAFCLHNLQFSTIEGEPNGIRATLMVTPFNYTPFSKDFSYKDDWITKSSIGRFRFDTINPIELDSRIPYISYEYDEEEPEDDEEDEERPEDEERNTDEEQLVRDLSSSENRWQQYIDTQYSIDLTESNRDLWYSDEQFMETPSSILNPAGSAVFKDYIDWLHYRYQNKEESGRYNGTRTPRQIFDYTKVSPYGSTSHDLGDVIKFKWREYKKFPLGEEIKQEVYRYVRYNILNTIGAVARTRGLSDFVDIVEPESQPMPGPPSPDGFPETPADPPITPAPSPESYTPEYETEEENVSSNEDFFANIRTAISPEQALAYAIWKMPNYGAYIQKLEEAGWKHYTGDFTVLDLFYKDHELVIPCGENATREFLQSQSNSASYKAPRVCNFISVGCSNRITHVPILSSSIPSAQSLGRKDDQVLLNIQSIGLNNIKDITNMVERVRRQASFLKHVEDSWVVEVENNLINATGSRFFVINSVDTATIPTATGLYNTEFRMKSTELGKNETKVTYVGSSNLEKIRKAFVKDLLGNGEIKNSFLKVKTRATKTHQNWLNPGFLTIQGSSTAPVFAYNYNYTRHLSNDRASTTYYSHEEISDVFKNSNHWENGTDVLSVVSIDRNKIENILGSADEESTNANAVRKQINFFSRIARVLNLINFQFAGLFSGLPSRIDEDRDAWGQEELISNLIEKFNEVSPVPSLAYDAGVLGGKKTTVAEQNNFDFLGFNEEYEDYNFIFSAYQFAGEGGIFKKQVFHKDHNFIRLYTDIFEKNGFSVKAIPNIASYQTSENSIIAGLAFPRLNDFDELNPSIKSNIYNLGRIAYTEEDINLNNDYADTSSRVSNSIRGRDFKIESIYSGIVGETLANQILETNINEFPNAESTDSVAIPYILHPPGIYEAMRVINAMNINTPRIFEKSLLFINDPYSSFTNKENITLTIQNLNLEAERNIMYKSSGLRQANLERNRRIMREEYPLFNPINGSGVKWPRVFFPDELSDSMAWLNSEVGRVNSRYHLIPHLFLPNIISNRSKALWNISYEDYVSELERDQSNSVRLPRHDFVETTELDSTKNLLIFSNQIMEYYKIDKDLFRELDRLRNSYRYEATLKYIYSYLWSYVAKPYLINALKYTNILETVELIGPEFFPNTYREIKKQRKGSLGPGYPDLELPLHPFWNSLQQDEERDNIGNLFTEPDFYFFNAGHEGRQESVSSIVPYNNDEEGTELLELNANPSEESRTNNQDTGGISPEWRYLEDIMPYPADILPPSTL